MALKLIDKPQPRKNVQVRLCDAASAAIDEIIAINGGVHSRSDVVEAAVLAAHADIKATTKGKS